MVSALPRGADLAGKALQARDVNLVRRIPVDRQTRRRRMRAHQQVERFEQHVDALVLGKPADKADAQYVPATDGRGLAQRREIARRNAVRNVLDPRHARRGHPLTHECRGHDAEVDLGKHFAAARVERGPVAPSARPFVCVKTAIGHHVAREHASKSRGSGLGQVRRRDAHLVVAQLGLGVEHGRRQVAARTHILAFGIRADAEVRAQQRVAMTDRVKVVRRVDDRNVAFVGGFDQAKAEFDDVLKVHDIGALAIEPLGEPRGNAGRVERFRRVFGPLQERDPRQAVAFGKHLAAHR